MKVWLLAIYGMITVAVVKYWQEINIDLSLLDIITAIFILGVVAGCYQITKIGYEKDKNG